jgi:hypothetical protein
MIIRAFVLIAIVLVSSAWIRLGGVGTTNPSASVPATANIPIASLSNGTYAANNWPGFTTNGTTASTTSTRKYLQTTTSASSNTLAIGTADWRDVEVTFYITRGRVILRNDGTNPAVYASFGIEAANSLRIGILSGSSYTSPEGGTKFNTYVQDTPAACITNWPTDSTHTFTLGARGMDIYLLIDGVQAYDTCQTTAINPTGAIRYQDYRPEALHTGKVSVWAHGGSEGGGAGNQITATYYAAPTLYSNLATSTFDPRDFGMRDLPATTGSMSAGSCTLTLSAARDIRVGDKIIVELGGESGAGARNTVGVGGTSPELHYADAAARTADNTQPNLTYAYIDTDGTVAQYISGAWYTTIGGPAPTMPASILYYGEYKTPVSLRASVIAVNASPATTLTLATFGADYKANCSTAATTNANVYLDSRYSFYPASTNPAATFANRQDGINVYTGMSMTVPAGTWYMGGKVLLYRNSAGDRDDFTLTGAGQAVTIFKSPKGVPSLIFEGNNGNDNTLLQDYSYVGNRADNGYMWEYLSTTTAAGVVNKNFPSDNPVAMYAGESATGAKAQRIDCLNTFRGCVVLTGVGPQSLDMQVVNTEPQRNYLQWEFMILNSASGTIKMQNLTATSPWLYKAFNCFATNGCQMLNLSGNNALLAVNGSSSTTITGFSTTIQQDSFLTVSSGWLDEGVVQISNNNNAGGSGGTISDFRIIHNGYTQVSSQRSLKSIDITATTQINWNVTGSYSGVSGCTSALGGYIEYIGAPYSSSSGSSYGAMGVVSAAANTVVSGIRVVGSAIGSPGLSSHYGNISASNTGNSISGSVADVLQGGTIGSGNRTNATFCP